MHPKIIFFSHKLRGEQFEGSVGLKQVYEDFPAPYTPDEVYNRIDPHYFRRFSDRIFFEVSLKRVLAYPQLQRVFANTSTVIVLDVIFENYINIKVQPEPTAENINDPLIQFRYMPVFDTERLFQDWMRIGCPEKFNSLRAFWGIIKYEFKRLMSMFL